jgi:hypothetical protein
MEICEREAERELLGLLRVAVCRKRRGKVNRDVLLAEGDQALALLLRREGVRKLGGHFLLNCFLGVLKNKAVLYSIFLFFS